MNGMLKSTALLAVVLLAAAMVTEGAAAHGKRLRLARPEPAILGVTVEPCRDDASLTCLHVVGVGLHDGVAAQVMLGDALLEIHALEGPGTNVFALLPEGLEAGVHTVQVSTAQSDLTRDVPLLGAVDSVPGYATPSATTAFDQGSAEAQATCPEGSVVVGGGYVISGADANIVLNTPVGHSIWQVLATAPLTSGGALTGYAVCLDPELF